MTEAFEHVRSHRDGATLVLTMDRPSRKNALTQAMYRGLTAGLAEATADASVRVVLIQGAGGSFTSGNDLMDFMSAPPDGTESPVFVFLKALVHFAKPLVAAVEGHAVGIGTTMLLHCDLVVAATTAQLKLPFTSLALVPEAGSSLLLPRMMGYQRAAELLLLGETFTAEHAHHVGIVNAVVPPESLYGTAMTYCNKLAAQAPEAVRLSKQLMRDEYRKELELNMDREAGYFVQRLGSPEFQEAIAAFMQKRQPDFSSFE